MERKHPHESQPIRALGTKTSAYVPTDKGRGQIHLLLREQVQTPYPELGTGSPTQSLGMVKGPKTSSRPEIKRIQIMDQSQALASAVFRGRRRENYVSVQTVEQSI